MLRSEEMLDKQGRLAGYYFSFLGQCAGGSPTAAAKLEALHGARVQSLAERRLAVIELALGDWAAADFTSVQGAYTVFYLAVPAEPASAAAWQTDLAAVRASGAALALPWGDEEAATAQGAEGWGLATHALITLGGQPIDGFERNVQALRARWPGLTLVVGQVSSWPERRLCLDLGAQFTMGAFLATVDAHDQREELTESRLVLMEMLKLVRQDGDAQALADVAKRDPGIAVRVLSMANSPAYGLSTPVTGLDQAIMVMGRQTLYRWLAVSVFRAGGDNARDRTLLEVALAWARFLELAGQAGGSKAQADELFLVGLLSFVDALLGLPMAVVVATMSLPRVVQEVLLRSEGPYGPYLLLALAVEKGRVERATQLASGLGLDAAALNPLRGDALCWAQEAAGQG